MHLAVESHCHLAERWMIIGILLHSDTIPPLQTADTANAVIRCAAVAVVSDVVGQDVVSGVGQMLVLNHKVNLDRLVAAPRLASGRKAYRLIFWKYPQL
jgi:hypothetical protein